MGSQNCSLRVVLHSSQSLNAKPMGPIAKKKILASVHMSLVVACCRDYRHFSASIVLHCQTAPQGIAETVATVVREEVFDSVRAETPSPRDSKDAPPASRLHCLSCFWLNGHLSWWYFRQLKTQCRRILQRLSTCRLAEKFRFSITVVYGITVVYLGLELPISLLGWWVDHQHSAPRHHLCQVGTE